MTKRTTSSPTRILVLILALAWLFPPLPLHAEESKQGEIAPTEAAEAQDSSTEAEDAGEEEPLVFERMRVVGTPEKQDHATGSVHYLDQERLARQDYENIHRTLTQVPGVNVRDEDGYGLRPNIGMRGSGVERSANITLMEDGVLIAPAPYSAPAAYYFPTAGRMEGIEVSKGSASIRQGPRTNGGVLNMISSSIPGEHRRIL